MKTHTPSSPRRAGLAAVAVLLLSSCGGDGGGVNPSVAGIETTSTDTPRYGDDLLITVLGRNLDKGVTASASGCRTFTLATEAPNVSSASTAYYLCTRPPVGSFQARFVRPSDGVVMATVPFTVPLPQVTLSVSNGAGVGGDIVVTLEAQKAPVTVDNFLAYVKAGFYTDTVFHRLVPGFIVQGGGYAKTLVPNGALPTLKTTNPAIVLEDNAGLSNLKGTLAMARTNAFNSATSQFFINLVDNKFLDRSASARGYAVFGSISAGADVVTAIETAPCSAWPAFLAGDSPSACVPSPNLVISGAVQSR